MEFDGGYRLGVHKGVGLLTTYGDLPLAGPESQGIRVGGRLALGAWADLSVKGERTMQSGRAEHQVASTATSAGSLPPNR